MALDTREGWYVSFTATPPFGVALLKRRMNGVIAVGAAFENDRGLKPAPDQIKPIVKRAPGSRAMNCSVSRRFRGRQHTVANSATT
jgi:hypothetical protein